MPRRKRRPLTLRDRHELALGALRAFHDGDDVASLAARLGQPAARVHEALDEPVDRVRGLMGRGVLAVDLAADTGLPVAFVKFAMRRAHARSRVLAERPRTRRGRPDRRAVRQPDRAEGVIAMLGGAKSEDEADRPMTLEEMIDYARRLDSAAGGDAPETSAEDDSAGVFISYEELQDLLDGGIGS